MAGEGCEEHWSARGGQSRHSQLHGGEQHVEGRPEARSWPRPHDSAEDGLARVERVPDGFEVEDQLQRDGQRSNPEDRRSELHAHRWSNEPLSAAYRRGKQNCARADSLEHVLSRERQRFWEFVFTPGRKASRPDGLGIKLWLGFHNSRLCCVTCDCETPAPWNATESDFGYSS